MDAFFSGVKAVVFSIIKDVPNPLSFREYTSCVCLVFNRTDEATLLDSRPYRLILDSMRETWGAGRPFEYLCPYDSDKTPTDHWRRACGELRDRLGAFPLIVLTGHCSPGSDHLSTDDQSSTFDVEEVCIVLAPFLLGVPEGGVPTVFLTPCSTGVDAGPEASFQKRFDACASERFGSRFCSIGTSSTSVPGFGKLHAEGLTFTLRGGSLSADQYLAQLRALREHADRG